jgi:RimJ/RimL family protein N-acetyltransferase
MRESADYTPGSSKVLLQSAAIELKVVSIASWMNNYIIETARLKLRPMQSLDIGAIHQISNEPGVRKYLFDDKPVSRAFIQEVFQQSVSNFESRNFGIWILREKRTPKIVGFSRLRGVEDLAETEILYALSELKWHFGYAIEAAGAVQHYAFDRAGLDCLIGITDAANVESWRVLERLGMCEYRPANADEHLRYAIVTRMSSTGPAHSPR